MPVGRNAYGPNKCISNANLSIGRGDIPAWVTSEVGKSMQKRVWDDLLKRLESIGHSVDIEALAAK